MAIVPARVAAKHVLEAATSASASDTLYFDGACSLCAAEIESLRQERGRDLALVDVHSLDTSTEERDRLLRTLHLQRADGTWLTGADANVAAWEGTPKARLLRILRWPVLRVGVDAIYRAWAAWRYRRLYGAREAARRDAESSVRFEGERRAPESSGH